MVSKVVRRSVKVRRSPIPTTRGGPISGGFLSMISKLNAASHRLQTARAARRR